MRSSDVVRKQFAISFWSRVTLPFVSYKENAAKDFFREIYNGKTDPYLFDGKSQQYLHQVLNVVELNALNRLRVIDIGSGNGVLYHWLVQNCVKLQSYLGIDFAHRSESIDSVAQILNADVINLGSRDLHNADICVLVNCACYLDSDRLNHLLSNLPVGCQIIIIDPIPGLFWDAHFDGVKLFYLSYKKMSDLLYRNDFIIERKSVDFHIKFLSFYFNPLSYCLRATKT